MIIKTTTQVGNPIIRARAKTVSDPTSKATKIIITNLIDSMRHHGLVGMAAPQIGKSVRIFVTEIRSTKFRKLNLEPVRVFINPKIHSFSKKKIRSYEGCGSVANSGIFGIADRSLSVVVTALDEHGKKFELKATKLLAHIIQHEMDHLNGIVFLDKSDSKTYMSANEYLKHCAKVSKK